MIKQKLIIIFFLFSNKETLSFSNANLETYLNIISFPKLTKEKSKILDGGITEKELLIGLWKIINHQQMIG